jgi:hypothetical protein
MTHMSRSLAALALLGSAACVVIVVGAMLDRPSEPHALPPPLSLGQLVIGPDAGGGSLGLYDIIVVGTIAEVVEIDLNPTPSPQPTELRSMDDLVLSEPSYYTRQRIDVEQIVLDDGTLARGGKLVINVLGNPPANPGELATQQAGWYPMGNVGERYLFFLHRDEWMFPSNGDYVMTWGPYGRLLVSAAPITYSDGARTPVPFATGMSPQQFIDVVVAEVDRSIRSRPTTRPYDGRILGCRPVRTRDIRHSLGA